ncbi:AAA family ATPase [Fodinicola feengrottensis]|uniref:AAA family ATPase n=1 Tax=Fodinicola feengrottensis TaxID=435914 RepID=UPI0013D3AAFE|nr:ATP-binding protein [Fodinicola feengrottensis]
MPAAWPLVGRSKEWEFVADAMGRQRGIVLAGAAGVGKTRLAREVLQAAARRGSTTRWAFASASARGLPLGALSPIISVTDGNPAQLLRHATDALAAGTDVVVGVDDAHLLDELSALVLYQLVGAGAAKVIVTVRTGEPAPAAVTALWEGSLLPRLEIQPLPEAATAELVAAALGGPVDSNGTAKLWSMTHGNALFLRQLVLGELDAGRLVDVGGVWRWSGAAGVSPVLAELVRARMGGLTDQAREVVDVLALGEPLGTELLVDLTGKKQPYGRRKRPAWWASSRTVTGGRRGLRTRFMGKYAETALVSCAPAGCAARSPPRAPPTPAAAAPTTPCAARSSCWIPTSPRTPRC